MKKGDTLWDIAQLYDGVTVDQIKKLNEQAISNSADENASSASMPPPAKDPTSFDDFMKMDIRTGTILEAERVPKTDKLLKLKVDTGIDQRTVVSGIAEYYEPSAIIGKHVTILVNLQPRKIRGIESQGMILMAEDKEGKLCFVSPEGEMGNGSVVR